MSLTDIFEYSVLGALGVFLVIFICAWVYQVTTDKR